MAEHNHYLLRIEAVNLSGFILDSEDLSTIRGAGMLVLGLHEFLTGWTYEDRPTFGGRSFFRAKADTQLTSARDAQFFWRSEQSGVEIELTLVSAGASIVVYSFGASDDTATSLRADADKWLRNHDRLRHATFSVDVQRLEDVDHQKRFPHASEAALQKIRRRQLRAPNVAIGPLQKRIGDPSKFRFCDIDGRRPGSVSLKQQPADDTKTSYAKAVDKNFASPATDVRRAYGRDTKIRVYHMIGGSQASNGEGGFTPAWEFGDIADRSAERRVEGDYSNVKDPWNHLSGKMAVIYIDGNQFGKQIRKAATTDTEYRDIDEKMLVRRRKLMTALTEQMKDKTNGDEKKVPRGYWRFKPQEWEKEQSDHYRIETLMWGGDELIWVVPAWCGLEAVSFFFEQTKNWSLKDEIADPRLTHAVGMVLCSHKSPIRSVVRLAKDLVESAKDSIRECAEADPLGDGDLPYFNQDSSNVLAYQVLESFDHIGNDFSAVRRRHRFPFMKDHEVILPVTQLMDLISFINLLRNSDFPRSRLYQIAQLLQRTSELPRAFEPMSRKSHPLSELLTRIENTTPSIAASRRSGLLAWPDSPATWYHVMELWDYLGSCSDRKQVQQ